MLCFKSFYTFHLTATVPVKKCNIQSVHVSISAKPGELYKKSQTVVAVLCKDSAEPLLESLIWTRHKTSHGGNG